MASALVGIRVGWGVATPCALLLLLSVQIREGPQDLYFNKCSATAIQNSRKAGLRSLEKTECIFYISSKENAYVYERYFVCKVLGFFP